MLPIRKVILYKHGVGYFERQGDIKDDDVIELAFRHLEMNDVLKSLTVLDLSGGIIQSISYESTRPLQQQLGDIALTIPDDHALTGLLAQIKGARVAVEIAGRQLEGLVAGIEKIFTEQDDASAPLQFLTLLVDGDALHTLDLRQIKRILLLDESLRHDLQHLLEILLGSKKKDRKHLTIFTRGKGKRSLFVSYVLEAPVWKTSYRILLNNDASASLIQGWALIDNTQEEDWDNVALTLVSGLPVSFVHDLYSPRYQKRPVIEVSQDTAYAAPIVESGRMARAETLADEPFAAAYEAGPVAAAASEMPTFGRMKMARFGAQSMPVQTATAGIGDSFQYEIQTPVTVRRQQSALVPILQTTFEGKRVVLFNPEIREKNPMSALLFKNTTGLMLEGGPLTVFEQDTYQGEAMLETLKPEAQRLIPFSIELGCLISQDHRNENLDVHQIIIVNGTAELLSYQLKRTVYFVDNKTGQALELYLDHRFKPGWELEDCESQPEITEHFYRFRLEAPAAQITRFTVTEKGKNRHTVSIGKLTGQQLQLWFDSRYIDDTIRRALNDLITLRETLAELEQRIAQAEQTIQVIFSNQERLRQNLQALGSSEDEKTLRERYVAELNQDEDKIKQAHDEIDRRRAEKQSLEQQLAARIKKLRYDSKPTQRSH